MSVNKYSARSDAILCFKAPDGDISIHPTEHNVSHSTVHHRCTTTELIRYCIDVFFKNDPVLHHKSTQFINELSPLFAEDILPIIPNGSSSIHFEPFRSWLTIQLDAPDSASPMKSSFHYHPVSKVLKIQSLSLNDANNEVAFHQAGFICSREDPGIAPLFNIKQHLWPYQQVPMDWVTISEAFCALAANILYTYAIDQQTDTHETPAFPICSAFADYFIEPMPYNGGHIPLQAIKDWLTIINEECLDKRASPLRA